MKNKAFASLLLPALVGAFATSAPAAPIAGFQTAPCYEVILYCKYQARDRYPTAQECWEAEAPFQCPGAYTDTSREIVARVEVRRDLS